MPPQRRVVGPGFHARVWSLVERVPEGTVVTYGQIATALGSPRVARQVGYAMAAALNSPVPIPWHRVINASGGISHRGDFERAQRQRELLEREGVEFSPAGTVDLARYRYVFPPVFPEDPVDPDALLARARSVDPRHALNRRKPRGTR